MSEISSLKSRTRSALRVARATVLAEAAKIVAARGPEALVITHLARAHGIAPLTVRRWLLAEGFSLVHLTRGRPSFARLAALEGGDEG